VTESSVQLLAEGTGPEIRTLNVTTVIDNVETTVKMQVIAIAEPDGTLWHPPSWPEEVAADVRAIREMLELALAGLKLR